MKKIKALVLCLIMLVVPIAFVGCGSGDSTNPYDKLINTLINYQESAEDLYDEYIYIDGIARVVHSGGGYDMEELQVRLRDLIIANNSIIVRDGGSFYYYFLFAEIDAVKNNSKEVIWSS